MSAYARMGIGLIISLLITKTALSVVADNSATAKEVFGVFILLISMISFGDFVNDSLQKSFIRFLSISIHRGDSTHTIELFRSGWLVSLGLGIILSSVAVILIPRLLHLFDISSELSDQARHAVLVISVINIAKAAVQPWVSALQAKDKFAVENTRILVERILILLGLYFLPYIKFPILIKLSVVWLSPAIITMVPVCLWMSLHYPEFRLQRRRPSWHHCKPLFILSSWSSLTGLASNFYERTDQVLINILLGPVYNAFYAIVLQFESMVSSVTSALTQVALPTASRLADSGSLWEKQQFVIRATKLILAVTLPFAVALSVFRQELVKLWLGEGFGPVSKVLPLAMLLITCRAPNVVTWLYLTAIGRLKWPALLMLADGIVNIGLSVFYVVILKQGFIGILMGTVSTSILRFIIFQGPYTAKHIGLASCEYWKRGFLRPLASTLWLGPLFWTIQACVSSSLYQVAFAGLTGCLYAGWVWAVVFDNYERSLLKDIMVRPFKRDAETARIVI